jgi:hypothetical protein
MLFGKASFPNFENLNQNNSQFHPEAPTNGSIPSHFDSHKKCVRLSVGGDRLSHRRLRGRHHYIYNQYRWSYKLVQERKMKAWMSLIPDDRWQKGYFKDDKLREIKFWLGNAGKRRSLFSLDSIKKRRFMQPRMKRLVQHSTTQCKLDLVVACADAMARI